MDRPRIIVFASGTKDGGGSGFENLVDHSRGGDLEADIVAVVSNHEHGGVRSRADRKGVRFEYYDGTRSYAEIAERFDAEWIALSGWLKKVSGLDARKTFNIHPALLSFEQGRFGGSGMYGHHIHEAVLEAFKKGEITETGFSMHFVTDEYDRGPIFYEHRIPLKAGMTADEIAWRVNQIEHAKQPFITNLVVHEKIGWDGKTPSTLRLPSGEVY